MKTRIEKDSLGEVEIPYEAYYGIYTSRSKDSFQITKRGLSRQMIKSLAIVKKACAKANCDAGLLTAKQTEAICLSCDEILNGRLHGQFVTDVIQGGAGLSINMNANEVIANRANEMLGGEKGKYQFVDPIKHLNMNQSTNEVMLTAGKITTIRLIKKLIVEGKKLVNAFEDKANEIAQRINNESIEGMSREKSLNYNRLYDEFQSFAYGLERALKRIDSTIPGLYEIAIGYTTNKGSEAEALYMKKVIKHLKQVAGDNFVQSKSLLDATKNFECFVSVSSTLKGLMVNLAKTASDLRNLSSHVVSEPIIRLPEIQAATNSVYDKNYPVVLDMVNQVCFFVIGTDATIVLAAEGNELDFNMYAPVLFASLFDSITFVRRAIRTLREIGIEGIKIR